MEDREERTPAGSLAHVMGMPVMDAAGVHLGVVVGRVLGTATIHLLVRRRRIFHRSRYMRLHVAAIEIRGSVLVYHPFIAAGRARLRVVPTTPHDRAQGNVV